MGACRLIVHADDFGLSERVNEGIVQAHRHGVLTSASLIASGDAFEHAVELSKATPTLDIGVHLTLIEERPLSPGNIIPTLLGDNGRFHRHAGAFMRRYLFGCISLDEVSVELDAQIDSVIARGINVSHLDGHQHMHMVPGIRRVVGRLARKYAIPSIRYPRETLRAYMLKERAGMFRVPQLLLLNFFCAVAGASDANRPDHFCGFFYGGRLSKDNLMRILDHLPSNGTCELMCHPGLDDAKSRYNHWGYRWQEERDALTDSAIRDYLKARDIRLISFSDLRTQ